MLVQKSKQQPVASPRPSEPPVHQWGYIRPAQMVNPTLPPRPQRWAFAAVLPLLLAVLWAGLQLVLGQQFMILAGALTACTISAATVVLGLRKKERDAISDRATEDIAPLVSTYLTRRSLKVLSWAGRWIGWPRKIRVIYAQGVADSPTLREDIMDALADRLGQAYRIVKDDPRHRRLVFEQYIPEPEPEEEELPEDVQRVHKVVDKLFGIRGAETHVEIARDDQGGICEIQIKHDIGDLIAEPAVRRVKERKFGNLFPDQKWKASWDVMKDEVTFHVRPPLPTYAAHPGIPPLQVTPQQAYETPIPYGVAEDGEIMAWRPWLDPMMMITGLTGRGKTVVAHAILAVCAALGWMVYVSDAKLVEFIGWKFWRNVRIVAGEMGSQVRVAQLAHDLMKERYAQIVAGTHTETDFAPAVFFLDEYALFREDLTDWYMDIKLQGEPTKCPLPRKVNAILRAGRTARVHLVLLTQRPDAETFGNGEARLNLSCRVSMGSLDFDGSRMMWGGGGLGMAVDRAVRGRGTTRNAAGDVVDFQAFWTPDPRKIRKGDLQRDLAILEGLYPAQDLWAKQEVVVPQTTRYDEKSDTELLPTYGEYAKAKIVTSDLKSLTPAKIISSFTSKSESPNQNETEEPAKSAEPVDTNEGVVIALGGPAQTQERKVLDLRPLQEPDIGTIAEVVPIRQAAPAEIVTQEDRAAELELHQDWEQDASPVEDIQEGWDVEFDGGWASVISSVEDDEDEDGQMWTLEVVTEEGEQTLIQIEIGEVLQVRINPNKEN